MREAAGKRILLYDRDREEHYNVISALSKSLRASDPDAAPYYLARMLAAGGAPLFIAPRLTVLAARDVVIGKTEQDHDLSLLQGRLRSHGGRYEEMVPLMLSMSPSSDQLRRPQVDPRPFDLYNYLCGVGLARRPR